LQGLDEVVESSRLRIDRLYIEIVDLIVQPAWVLDVGKYN
jgi:hypothetical protein